MADNVNISSEMIENLVNMLKNNNTESDKKSDTSSNDTFNNIDFDTIMKFKSIADTLNNKNDRDSNLLYSLKPYLRKGRQEKLDQYINILKISQLSKLFKNNSGDDT